jgi:hypothetical protein
MKGRDVREELQECKGRIGKQFSPPEVLDTPLSLR